MKGILFKPDMIKAIAEGRKTVTRRVCIGQRELSNVYDFPVETARYQVGEVVYIKEAWLESFTGDKIYYKLDGDNSHCPKVYFGKDKQWHDYKTPFWRSPMFLKAIHARYFIKIKDVRAERLQEIGGDDYLDEGVTRLLASKLGLSVSESEEEFNFRNARHVYRVLWDSINKDCPWQSNPWVWRYEFELVTLPA